MKPRRNTESKIEELITLVKKLAVDIEEIKEKQERLIKLIEGTSYSPDSYQLDQLIAQHGGDVIAAIKDNNRRQKLLYKMKEGKA